MDSKKRSGSTVFLMEMIMNVGFFLLCAAVCVQVFVKADAMSRLAREKNQAVLMAESLTESWKADALSGFCQKPGDEDLLDGWRAADGTIYLYFNEAWQPVGIRPAADESLTGSRYEAQLEQVWTSGRAMRELSVRISRPGPAGPELFFLAAKDFAGERGKR